MLTGQGMAEYAKSKLGMPYFYGAKIREGILTEVKMNLMHKMYPGIVTFAYMVLARAKGQVGKVNTDCSGLPAGYRQKNLGSAQLFQTAYTRLPIANVKDFAPGVILWKSGHVGVYIGMENGVPMCIEAKGINYGTVKTKVSATKWQYGLTFSDISYTYENKVEGSWKGENPYKKPSITITSKAQAKKQGLKIFLSTGDGVRWVQWELVEAGYDIKIDGICGKKTVAAIIDYQRSCKITADGLAGKNTRRYLSAA